jgi:excisionase family DNA binding protein
VINGGVVVAPLVYTVAEAAVILHVKESWLQRRAAAREIPFTMLGGAYHFTAEHITDIIRRYERIPVVSREPKTARSGAPERQVGESLTMLCPRPRPEGPRRKRSAA